MLQGNNENYIDDRDFGDTSYIEEEGHFLNMQLTDDFNGKHLTEFEDALHKSGLSFHEFKNPVNKNYLNIFITKEVYDKKNVRVIENDFYINDKIVELKDKTLPLFMFLGKILNEVQEKRANDFKLDKNYFDSDEANKGFSIGNDLKDLWDDEYYQTMEEKHSPEKVKKGTQDMKNLFTNIMMGFFNN